MVFEELVESLSYGLKNLLSIAKILVQCSHRCMGTIGMLEREPLPVVLGCRLFSGVSVGINGKESNHFQNSCLCLSYLIEDFYTSSYIFSVNMTNNNILLLRCTFCLIISKCSIDIPRGKTLLRCS